MPPVEICAFGAFLTRPGPSYAGGNGSRRQILLLVLSVALVTVSTLPVFLTGAAFFQIGPEFGIGPFGLGALTAAFFLTAAVSSPGLGRWVQRVGWQRARLPDGR